ncbi:hypothetical protein NIES2104_15750 [Leptolyngbya sp. NIES-2104]|nr:hypothetical protein NIES2104_15750 [Leptolyngbya sp. NIES-2104]
MNHDCSLPFVLKINEPGSMQNTDDAASIFPNLLRELNRNAIAVTS